LGCSDFAFWPNKFDEKKNKTLKKDGFNLPKEPEIKLFLDYLECQI
jgi:hypothetical protein